MRVTPITTEMIFIYPLFFVQPDRYPCPSTTVLLPTGYLKLKLIKIKTYFSTETLLATIITVDCNEKKRC